MQKRRRTPPGQSWLLSREVPQLAFCRRDLTCPTVRCFVPHEICMYKARMRGERGAFEIWGDVWNVGRVNDEVSGSSKIRESPPPP